MQVAEYTSLNILCQDTKFEFCLTKYIFVSIQFVMIGIFRSSSSNVSEFLEKLNIVLKIFHKCKRIIIAGDFNITILNDKELREFKNLISSHGINYMVDFPIIFLPISLDRC